MKDWLIEYSIWMILAVNLVMAIKLDMKFIGGVIIGIMLVRVIVEIRDRD